MGSMSKLQPKATASQPTRWSLIVRAQGSGVEARDALAKLLEEYWGFVVFLLRVNRHPPDVSVEDLAQEFALGVVRRNDIAKLDPGRGSFRAWLRRAVRSFLCNEWARWKRKPAIDHGLYEQFHHSTPEEAVCDRAFLAFVLERALAATRVECADKARFDRIARYLPGSQADLGEAGELARLAQELGQTKGALTKFVHDTRRRFERQVDAILWQTLDLAEAGEETSDGPTSAAGLEALREAKLELLRSLDLPEGGVLPCKP